MLTDIIFDADAKIAVKRLKNRHKDVKGAIFLEKYQNALSAHILMQNSYQTVIFESDCYFQLKCNKIINMSILMQILNLVVIS